MDHIQIPLYVVVLFCFGIPLAMLSLTVPMWFICRKAGFSPWLTLLNCIPFGTPVLLYLLAFADWNYKNIRPRAAKTQMVVEPERYLSRTPARVLHFVGR